MGRKAIAGLIIVLTLIFAGVIFLVFASAAQRRPENSPPTQTLSELESQKEVKVVEKITARLDVLNPKVSVSSPGGEFEEVTKSKELSAGMKIKTEKGAKAQIVYSNKSVTRIDENSQITVDSVESENKFTPSIFVETGRIWSRIAKLLGAESYETKSESVVATVRGTSFGHSTDSTKKQDTLISTRKNIKVNCANKAQSSEVKEGEKGNFNCKQGTKPLIQTLTSKDLSDKWIKYNIDEDKKLDKLYPGVFGDSEAVLGATPSPSPASTTPTSTQTPSPTSTSTSTSTTSPIPTPLPTQTPQITITSISATGCYSTAPCSVQINGSGLSTVTKVDAIDSKTGSPTESTSIDSAGDTILYATFNSLGTGDYYIEIQGFKSATTFNIR